MDIYLVCYEPNYADVLEREIGKCPNSVAVFYDYEKAKEFGQKFVDNNQMVFISKGKQENGMIVNGEILWEYGEEY